MNILYFLSRFFYRIRYPLIFGTLFASLLAIYFTSFLPKTYVVTTTVFTGITSKPSLDDLSSGSDWNAANNAHDNIINLVRSKSTLQTISMALFAQHLIYGDPNQDNYYITAEHYRELMKIVPEDVLALVDKSSMEKTIENFAKYRTEDRNNFIYGLFSWDHRHYSYLALSQIGIRRMQSSDMIEISYGCDDPGIAANTVGLLNKELASRWEDLLLSTSNDVVKHFEEQLALAERQLHQIEDSLLQFNAENRIINYTEQTKHLVTLNNNFEMRYEEILLENRSSMMLLKELEGQMDTRVSLIQENQIFLGVLNEISTLNGKIAEIEIFGGSDEEKNKILDVYQKQLTDAESRIKDITLRIDSYKQSKEGVAIAELVTSWLQELIKYNKSSAELTVMENRRQELDEQYDFYSPVGPNLGRLDRSVRVAEESYLTLLHHLGLAKLKQKNILLNSGTLQVVTPPEFPLLSMPRKRKLYVIVVFLAAIVFITLFFLLLEMLDRTVRDKERAERFTKGRVIGAFPRKLKSRYRAYMEEIRHISAGHIVNRINERRVPTEQTVINLLSVNNREGKSFVAERLQDAWQEMGYTVKYLSYGTDFITASKTLLQTEDVSTLLAPEDAQVDIVLMEFDALRQSAVPKGLIEKATVNLFVVTANRAWTESDQILFDDLRKISGGDSLYICLNRTSREALEEIVGQLPPFTALRNWIYTWCNFGITSHPND